MTQSLRAVLALLTALVLAFTVSACGGNDEEEPAGGNENAEQSGGEQAGGKLIQKDSANAGKTFTVGSKNFAEQYILGEIYAQSLEAAGFKVKKQLDLGSEQVAFKSLKSGRFDAYP